MMLVLEVKSENGEWKTVGNLPVKWDDLERLKKKKNKKQKIERNHEPSYVDTGQRCDLRRLKNPGISGLDMSVLFISHKNLIVQTPLFASFIVENTEA